MGVGVWALAGEGCRQAWLWHAQSVAPMLHYRRPAIADMPCLVRCCFVAMAVAMMLVPQVVMDVVVVAVAMLTQAGASGFINSSSVRRPGRSHGTEG